MISQPALPNCMSFQSVSLHKDRTKTKQCTDTIIMLYNDVQST